MGNEQYGLLTINYMKNNRFEEGFLWGFAITTILWCTLFAYIIGKL
jgi:hypothetical protein